MNRRVAFIATLAVLAVCLTYLFVIVNAATADQLALKTQQLHQLCRMSEAILDNAALAYLEEDELETQFRGLALTIGADVALIDRDGTLLFSYRTPLPVNANPAADPEVRAARAEGEGEAVRASSWGQTVYVARRLSDGRIVRMAARAPMWWDAPMQQRVMRMALLVVPVGVLCYLLIRWTFMRVQLSMVRMTQLFEAFAEGRFEERILGVPGRSKRDVARINAAANRIEEQLVRQKRRNQAVSAVIYQMQSGILAVDVNMDIMLVTPLAKRLLGLVGTLEGVSVMEASKDVHLEPVFQEAMLQDGVYMREVAVRNGTGRGHRPLRLYVSAMRQDGEAIGALALIEDITQLRRLEEVRNDFVANVSHELKTPLTSIRGFVETLQAGAINHPEKADKFLRIIMLEAERLTRLINDILAITKLESGTVESLKTRVRIDQMIHDVADMLRIHADEKEITIHARLSDEPLYVMGNPDRVQQMLINLIENGIKYNQPGGSVTVQLFGTDENVQLLISDTGIGIDEDHLPRLFERFYRVDKGRSRNMGGTGLGLAIVKHIIRGMGGMIEVHSKLGEGTEFLVTLPRLTGSEDAPAEDEGLEAEN